MMKFPRFLTSLAIFVMIVGQFSVSPVAAASPAAAGPVNRTISVSGTGAFVSQPQGVDGIQSPEFRSGPSDAGAAPYPGVINDRSRSTRNGSGDSQNGESPSNQRNNLLLSFDGLNHRNQRLANGGNQFSLEPPDQGLCVGNGYVVETVNTVLRVYDTAGNPLTGVIDLNTFYGYPSEINRSTGVVGPEITDPSCYFDAAVNRWFLVVLTLDVDANGNLNLVNHLDLAVSTSANPLDPWKIYQTPSTDDGTQGTPVHTDCPCIADYPHIGADANGFYISTNEYPWLTNGFDGAQIYAYSKTALAANAATVPMVQFDTNGLAAGNPGFTVWPATATDARFDNSKHGTEFFLSSDAADEANGTHVSNRIFLWKLTNTASINASTPNLALTNTAIPVGKYAVPPLSDQKPGPNPLGQCINDTTSATPFGPGCWQLFFVTEPAHNEVLSHIDSNDSRMQQVVYANGKLWGALDTAVTLNHTNKAGIEYFIIDPNDARAEKHGYVAMQNNNANYPAITATNSGKGIIAFTLVGKDYFPSAAYVTVDADHGAGQIQVASSGVGPDDGFTSYVAFVGSPPRTRWGDYGAAVVNNGSVWMASEYINQTCTLTQYLTGPLGSCGGTRTSLANWGTRISNVRP